ncbi:MAG: DUF1800 domain-containing protein [Fimbriimonadaceae bacterium]|nr:DUF1800 domain-containing protein [Fimbriimonadaceae bacterium]
MNLGIRPSFTQNMAIVTEQDKVRHLLRRFGLGASASEVEYYGKDGSKGALELLLNWEEKPDAFSIRAQDFGTQEMPVNMRLLQSWWYLYFAATTHPLQARLCLFWHDHFATARSKVDKVPAMLAHMEMLRRSSGGTFLNLITAVSKDPAMLYWLDNCLNTKDRPNENFAREVMELFTLGVDGGYTEDDVQAAAKAFTGWTFTARTPQRAGGMLPRNAQVFRGNQLPGGLLTFYNDTTQHASGTKRILGKSGDFNGEDVLRILCEHPGTARYIVRKFWETFVYYDPSDSLVNRVADEWRTKNLDIRALVRIVESSPEFYSDKAERALVKSPVEFTVSTARALGLGGQVVQRFTQAVEADRRAIAGLGLILTNSTTAMGQEMMNPPDVSGWTQGEGWISSATMVERIKWAERLFGGRPTGGRQPTYAFNLLPFLTEPTVPALINKMIEVFDASPTTNQKARMIEAAQSAVGTANLNVRNIGVASAAAAKLLFGSPEFQLN